MNKYQLLYDLYERRLTQGLDKDRIPRHVGIILDGNRRWAKAEGNRPEDGHRAGADKITEVLQWCDEAGVKVVTLWLLSIENLQRRSGEELAQLEQIISQTVLNLCQSGHYHLRVLGNLTALSADFRRCLTQADESGPQTAMVVNVAVGYGGRQEILDAVKSLLRERAQSGQSLEDLAESISLEDITDHLYTKGQPDPDLVIRTSGEQRLSGFLLWQSAHSEYYFCETYWPDFRKIDFLRALRDYASRERRLGH